MGVLQNILDLQATLNATTNSISTDVQVLQATAADLRMQIVTLQEQLAAGGALTEADLQPVLDAMVAHEAALEGVHAAGQPTL